MNSHERYKRSFSAIGTSHAFRTEECTMEEKSGRRIRMSRRLLIACILIICMLALSGISYAATGSPIPVIEKVTILFGDGTKIEKAVEFTVDEDGVYRESGNWIDEEHVINENDDGSVRIEGEGWDMEISFGTTETDAEDEGEGEEAPEEG